MGLVNAIDAEIEGVDAVEAFDAVAQLFRLVRPAMTSLNGVSSTFRSMS